MPDQKTIAVSAAIDIGNTRIKIGFFENDKLLEVCRFGDLKESKEILLAKKIQIAIFCSVVQSEAEILENFSFIPKKLIFSSKTKIPINNDYLSTSTLGLDRLSAAIGANYRFPALNNLIIDLGTAIKYDLVDKDGHFIGGIISPGKMMRFKALNTFTKKLPLLDSNIVPPLIGNDTNSCIISGVMNGILEEINGIIERYRNIYQDLNIIICGGDAVSFESQIKYPTFANPNLVLEGLNRILYYNVENI